MQPIVTASLAAVLRARLGGGLSALVGIEIGAPLLGIDALVDGVAVAGIRGPMLAARAGLALD